MNLPAMRAIGVQPQLRDLKISFRCCVYTPVCGILAHGLLSIQKRSGIELVCQVLPNVLVICTTHTLHIALPSTYRVSL